MSLVVSILSEVCSSDELRTMLRRSQIEGEIIQEALLATLAQPVSPKDPIQIIGAAAEIKQDTEPLPISSSERKKTELAERVRRLRDDPSIIEHGLLNGYNNYGCRCNPCTNAYMEWYGVYSTRKGPRRKSKMLPAHLSKLADSASPELKRLIEEQAADDSTNRIGYAVRHSSASDMAVAENPDAFFG